MSYLHILGIFLRYTYLFRHSSGRLLGLLLWILVELFVWGFLTMWLQEAVTPDIKTNLAINLLGAYIFWDIFYRAQQGVMTSFLEDIWSRNTLNIFSAPITGRELIVSWALVSILYSAVSFLLLVLLAWLAYALNIWSLGIYLLPFFINVLIFGWVLGFVSIGFLIWFGPSFEAVAWAFPVLFQPLSAVFYPVAVLPEFFQKVAFFLPTSHLFEGMRNVIAFGIFPTELILWATALNVLYVACSLMFFYIMLNFARKRGALSRMVTE